MKVFRKFVSLMTIISIIVCIAIPMRVDASEVESLPAFSSDVELSYDSDGMLVKTSKYEQYLLFNQSLQFGDGYISSYNLDGSISYMTTSDFFPKTVNKGSCSYWYSPSESRIYVLSGYMDNIYNVRSYCDGMFSFGIVSKGYYMCLSYYDLSSGCFYPLSMIRERTGVEFRVGDYIDVDGVLKNLPDDLVCIYSNYEISGFYEPNVSGVFTPNYYFKYQYLFYVENVGYTFVDSALPLISITNSDPTKAILMFDDVCNKRVYTSFSGISWTELTNLNSMYSYNILLDYSYFYDAPAGNPVYVLVYSNDDGYDEPLILPEYGDFEDVSDLIKDYTFEEIIKVDSIIDELPIEDLGSIGNILNIALILIEGDYSSLGDMLVNSSEYSYSIQDYLLINSIYSELSSDVSSYFYIDGGVIHAVEQTSLRTYIKSLSNDMDDLVLYVKILQIGLHNDLKSVFDNISVTNTYLHDIKKLVKDLPDYSKDFKELKEAINNIDMGDVSVTVPNINIPEIDVSDINIPDYTQELTDIQHLLENLELDVNVPASSFDDTDILHYLTDINTTIKLMNSPIGVDDVVDVFDGLSDDEGMLDIGNFVMNAIATIHTGKVLNMAFTYMGSLSNGIGWINGHVQSIFDASDVFRGVILLGVTMFTVNLIVRRDA